MSARIHSKSRYGRTVPTYQFKGVNIKIYSSKGRFSAQFKGSDNTTYRFEKGTEGEALEEAKKEIRKQSDIDVQIALREESAAAEILKLTDISVIEAARLVVTSTQKLAPLGAMICYLRWNLPLSASPERLQS